MVSEIYRTKTGRVLTDADIEALSREAERDWHVPQRGSDVERWLRGVRDQYGPGTAAWLALDDLLDAYRLCSDTGLPLPVNGTEPEPEPEIREEPE